VHVEVVKEDVGRNLRALLLHLREEDEEVRNLDRALLHKHSYYLTVDVYPSEDGHSSEAEAVGLELRRRLTLLPPG